ncbi:hypothetical protein [Nocardia sp. NBC_00511]|uniref:hypothetical protein n=1 Tax=Nocardia sp. NBC_00511 TaxID=2903591 RepID=UPI0030E49D66
MPLDTWTLILVALSGLLLVAAIHWGISDDHSRPTRRGADYLVADNLRFPRVPTHNLHRVHGRHRAW